MRSIEVYTYTECPTFKCQGTPFKFISTAELIEGKDGNLKVTLTIPGKNTHMRCTVCKSTMVCNIINLVERVGHTTQEEWKSKVCAEYSQKPD